MPVSATNGWRAIAPRPPCKGRRHERACLACRIPIVRTDLLPGPDAPPPAPAPNSGRLVSCIRTEDGTVILFDRKAGLAVSGLTRAAAEAALLRLLGAAPGAA
ncbi:MAG: hypothetical protein EOQ63_18605 [Mesorhizobium sp.]|nr:MAG: hypothetical protein EOQ63_18605 [Mesorhizobium sp.]